MYAEPWQGVDGPKVWQTMIDSGFHGDILQVGDRLVLGSSGGEDLDFGPYPPALQFSEGGVTYEFLAISTSDSTLDDLVDAVRSLKAR